MMKTKMLSIQKMVAMIIATLIMVLSVSSYQMNAGAVNTEQYYRVYNAQTGSLMRRYKLDPLESHTNTRSIIDDDNRDVDWSKSGVCKIITTAGSFGTGFVVDAHTIATAAHCLYHNQAGSRSLSDILLFDTSGNITLHATPIEYHIPINFISKLSSVSGTNEYDYALITVEEDLSDYACFDLGVMLDDFTTSGTTLSVTGFPQIVENTIVNSVNNHNMYTGEGIILSQNDFSFDLQLTYTNDVTGGNSGGPVYLTESRCGYTYYIVIGINTTSLTAYNLGTRITTDLIHFYKNNPNLNWE